MLTAFWHSVEPTDSSRQFCDRSESYQTAIFVSNDEHLKHHLGFERLRLRGLTGAQDEFLLAATAQNLRRLAKLTAMSPPPYPVPA